MSEDMRSAEDLASSKGDKDENFPVASWLIAPRNRPLVMCFYRFARAADDVADHPTVSADERLRILDEMGDTLKGSSDANPLALNLRQALAERGLTIQYGLDLLSAFRLDVSKSRYEDWDDLMAYCALSAAPVGRFMLDVHDEDKSLWPLSDALCAALQVINHLQDCGDDYCQRDRVYIPLENWRRAGLAPDCLADEAAPLALLKEIENLAHRTQALLREAAPFARKIEDWRLGLDVAVIQALAVDLTERLTHRDPLSQKVHHGKRQALGIAIGAMARQTVHRCAPWPAKAGA